MKIKYTIILFLFLLSLNYIVIDSQQIEFQTYDEVTQDTFSKYPYSSNTQYCYIDFKLWVIQLTGNGQMEIVCPGGVNCMPSYSNSTHFLYSISQIFGFGSIDTLIKVTGNGIEGSFNFIALCKEFDISNISIETNGKIYYDFIHKYVFYYRAINVPEYTSIQAKGGNGFLYSSYPVSGDGKYLLINYIDQNTLGGTLQIDFLFGNNTITKYVDHYFNSSFYDQEFKINYYPNLQDIQYIGNSFSQVITIETTTHSTLDYFLVKLSNGINFYPISTPIYESNGKTTHMVSLQAYTYLNSTVCSLYTQNKTSIYKVSEGTMTMYNDNSLAAAFLESNSTVSIDQDIQPLLNMQITGQTNKYRFGIVRFEIQSLELDIGSPYGFVTSDSYEISIPVLDALSTFGINNDFKSVNNNNLDLNGPLIKSYSFIYLSNSNYIFKVEITDDYCGAGYYSFDLITFSRLSQYRVSGHSLNGSYEIPINFDLDLSFKQIVLYDLCGKSTYYMDGDVLSINSQLSIPFFKYKYQLQDKIKNISYLYNNLDVRSQSVSNIIYFNCDGADIKTPFSFRLPIKDSIDTEEFYTKEYYGIWNSTINKFQIEFVVPKNSRLGPFSFIIATSQLNTVQSSYFSPELQLIISKSNFDGIGPVISKVSHIPFSDGKFGWSLTIVDPINGFDNGTVIVEGSQDHTIYKFNLLPNNIKIGNPNEGVWDIIIDLGSNYCITQDYVITFIKLWDTGAQYTVFQYTKSTFYQTINQLINPLYLFNGNKDINKISISQCNAMEIDLTPPIIDFISVSSSINVGSANRVFIAQIQISDPESGVRTKAQGPVFYITSGLVDILECITSFKSNTSETNGLFECSVEVPVGFGSDFGVAYLSIYGLTNNHGVYIGYSSAMLKSLSYQYRIDIAYSISGPLIISSSSVSSKGGLLYIYGRDLLDIEKIIVLDSKTNMVEDYTNIQTYSSASVISLSNLKPIKNEIYISVQSKSGIISNSLLLSPVIFNEYSPIDDYPTNPPQQCLGSPICGGPSRGICNGQTGCVCYYPWRGSACQDQIINIDKPDTNTNEPTTNIDYINYKSFISMVSLREINLNGETVKNHIFNNNKWIYGEISELRTNYLTNITTGNDGFNTTVSITIEWFNQSKIITFAGQELNIYSNSIKYTIDILKYPFASTLNSLQLVMSAKFNSTSSNSCSSKDFGDTTSGDNSNYINIQIDNKSLYGRLIKRGIIDNKIISLSNELLDSTFNAISTPSESQSYIGITIPQFNDRATIDPDFSLLLNSNSASSVCKSKLSNAQIAGIAIGGAVFLTIVIIIIILTAMKTTSVKIFMMRFKSKINDVKLSNLTKSN